MIEIKKMTEIAKESIESAKYDRQRYKVNAIQVVGGEDDGKILVAATTRFQVEPGGFLRNHCIIDPSDITSEDMLRGYVIDTVEVLVTECDREVDLHG